MGLRQTAFFESAGYEEEDTKIVICKQCLSHLCLSSHIISDNFQGSSGPAYLVDQVINITADPALQEASMRTGDYLISMVRCHQCDSKLGWNYKKSYKYLECYKEGKYVIENFYIKLIPNNSCTASLMRNKNLRRRSSASTVSSTTSPFSSLSDHEDASFKFVRPSSSSVAGDVKPRPYGAALDLDASFLNRLRFRSVAAEKLDEDEEALVDV